MHFAAHCYVGESVQNPRRYFDNNVEAALSLLNSCVDAGIKHFVFSSTCADYGTPIKVPMAEDTPRLARQSLVFPRCSLRERWKLTARLRHANLRYFNAAGADEEGEIGECDDPETHRILLALVAAAVTGAELQIFGNDYLTPDGTCIRDYIHVNDLASAHVKALQHLMNEGTSFAANLGTGAVYSVMEILRTIEEITGKKVLHRIAGRRARRPTLPGRRSHPRAAASRMEGHAFAAQYRDQCVALVATVVGQSLARTCADA